MNSKLVCPCCGAEYSTEEPIWRCNCGSYLDIDFKPEFKKQNLSSEKTLWRYDQVLPVDKKFAVAFDEGYTPLISSNFWGMKVLCKLDFIFPTGSFKDRGAALLISKCKELGITEIVEDSSGNSACSVSAYCARAGITANIYMPAGNSTGKAVQAKAYGSTIHLVQGNREDCANAALEGAQKSYYAAHAWNPYFLQGTKTVIYETVEQLGWDVPDYIFVPVGSGTLLLGIYLGLGELLSLSIIDKMPKLIAVQSEKCSPLKDYVEGKKSCISDKDTSIAEGIAIHKPIRLTQIINAVTESKGDFVTVDDTAIIEALKESAHQGIFIEPTSAAAIAALKQYAGKISPRSKVLVILTGSGLKTIATIEKLL